MQMRKEKANLLELASIRVREAFGHRSCDINENELKSMAATQVEVGAEALRHLAPTNGIPIRLGFICRIAKHSHGYEQADGCGGM